MQRTDKLVLTGLLAVTALTAGIYGAQPKPPPAIDDRPVLVESQPHSYPPPKVTIDGKCWTCVDRDPELTEEEYEELELMQEDFDD